VIRKCGQQLKFDCLTLCCSFAVAVTLVTKANAAVEQPSIGSAGTISADAADNVLRRKYSLLNCFDQADKENNEILVAAADLPVAQAAKVIASAIPNPTFNLTYGFGPAWELVVAGNNQQFGWTEEILVAGKRTKRINVARANYLQNVFHIEAVRFDVHNRVFRAYVELAAAIAYAQLIEDQRAIAQQLLSISQKRYDAGKAPGSEALQARLSVMQFVIQRNQARGRLIQDSTQLALLMGETPQRQEIIQVDENGLFKSSAEKSFLIPNPERPVVALQELLPTAWRERKDLQAAVQQSYVDKKAVTLAKSQRVPNPTVGFDYLFSTYKPFQLRFFDPTGSGVAEPANRVPQQPGYLFTYAQEQPLFYRYQGQVKQAEATLALQEKQNEQLRTQVASSILASYEALVVANNNVRKYNDQLLPSASKVAQLTRRGYELGKNGLATAMLAQQQYQQTRAAYFDAVVAYQNAWADLEKAVGVPLKTDG
jgi:cobalt-zinc-cadmium efflux system outer membrane protein